MLRLDGVTAGFGAGHRALDGVDLEVADHETVCVLGPSGSGKSTLLRVVAGLHEPDSGRVLLSGRDQSGVPPHRRGVGLMFQDHQLFPQRDVGGNVAFGLRMRGTGGSDSTDGTGSTGGAARTSGTGRTGRSGTGVRRGRGAGRREVDARVDELLDLVGLPGARGRAVNSLSGGEQQRVALARALAPQPRLLMLDEPLGQLDRGLRERLVVELRALFRRLRTTVLAVTHDQAEAFVLADRVVVMKEGRIAQAGTPLEVWLRPASEFVARFLGFDNVVDATVHGAAAETPWGKLPVEDGTPEGRCRLLVRPGAVRLTEPEDGLPCTVEARTFRGGDAAAVTLLLSPDNGPRLEATCALREAPEPGDRVGVTFPDGRDVVRLGAGGVTDDG
ncbi:ABC transporter ATP-binding protein [Streptomyces marispadix]|uniref:ABC transporter ATP-binding protein n=1 Tax=Streptomyces marispadix TaxID=2922868 RepID=A0ABS9T3Q9_9ACTN|nr:ABC transporter ATP-binding protein [Streptomyces marispadix]MCH6162891.1 ABC transporter ATP-binding protein [Streptomyces marispadix]